jgi:hypothetical protein
MQKIKYRLNYLLRCADFEERKQTFGEQIALATRRKKERKPLR